jgi:hypothetical protein
MHGCWHDNLLPSAKQVSVSNQAVANVFMEEQQTSRMTPADVVSALTSNCQLLARACMYGMHGVHCVKADPQILVSLDST